MAQAMDPEETIFVQTDPTFTIVLDALKELGDQNRLQVTHFQTASLEDIESNIQGENFRLTFGGAWVTPAQALQAFSRTASSVVRMCMSEATNIRRGLWQQIGKYSGRRNKAKLVAGENRNFSLANNKTDATRYWSKYDQLYPHSLIKRAIRANPINTQTSLPSMMIIFRNNFTEVIEITTTFRATPRDRPLNFFNSFVHVTCIVRSITQGEDGPDTKRMKDLIPRMKAISIGNSYFDEMLRAKTEKDLTTAFKYLKIEEKPAAAAVVQEKEKDEEEEEEVEEEEDEEEEEEKEKDEQNDAEQIE